MIAEVGANCTVSIEGRDASDIYREMDRLIFAAGAKGIVKFMCSPDEMAVLKAHYSSLQLILSGPIPPSICETPKYRGIPIEVIE